LDGKMKDIATQIKSNSDIKSLSLDLRGNTGGLLNQEVEVVSYFVDPDQVVVQEKSKTELELKKSNLKNPSLKDYPLVVLIDRYSASASEILAGSLRDIRGVKLIGQTSYGKGVVQSIYTLSNGDSLKLTIAEWLTPKGSTINKVGLKPDQEIPLTQDILDVVLAEK
jgi:carboxyl-terminal processing protease